LNNEHVLFATRLIHPVSLKHTPVRHYSRQFSLQRLDNPVKFFRPQYLQLFHLQSPVPLRKGQKKCPSNFSVLNWNCWSKLCEWCKNWSGLSTECLFDVYMATTSV